ncbi:HNH endonuclease, partial [Streptomyces sp. SID10244]|nr:HNH endonuclease [Streptomyces sp. SID10244]
MAYLAGDLSTHRMSVMVYAARSAPVATAEPDFEDIALDLASRPSTDKVLRDELEEVLISLDPEGAAEARDGFADAWQNVAITDDSSGHANIDACV